MYVAVLRTRVCADGASPTAEGMFAWKMESDETRVPFILVRLVLQAQNGRTPQDQDREQWVLPPMRAETTSCVTVQATSGCTARLAVCEEPKGTDPGSSRGAREPGTWVLPSEIANARTVLGREVHPSVVRLLLANPWLGQVRDSLRPSLPVPLPEVAFTACVGPRAEAEAAFQQLFGNSRTEDARLDPLRPHYYFFSRRALPECEIANRYAVFVQQHLRAEEWRGREPEAGAVRILDAPRSHPNIACDSWDCFQWIGGFRPALA